MPALLEVGVGDCTRASPAYIIASGKCKYPDGLYSREFVREGGCWSTHVGCSCPPRTAETTPPPSDRYIYANIYRYIDI